LGIIQLHAAHPQAAKLLFSSQTNPRRTISRSPEKPTRPERNVNPPQRSGVIVRCVEYKGGETGLKWPIWVAGSYGLRLRGLPFALALMPLELFLQIGLSVNGLRQGAQRHFENLIAIVACPDAWSSTQPLNDLKTTLYHNASGEEDLVSNPSGRVAQSFLAATVPTAA